MTRRAACGACVPRPPSPCAARRVIPRQCGQVDAGDCLEHPGGLMVLFDRSPPRQGGAAAFDRRGVGLRGAHPVHVQRHAGVSRLCHLRKLRGLIGDPGVFICIGLQGLSPKFRGPAQGRMGRGIWQDLPFGQKIREISDDLPTSPVIWLSFAQSALHIDATCDGLPLRRVNSCFPSLDPLRMLHPRADQG